MKNSRQSVSYQNILSLIIYAISIMLQFQWSVKAGWLNSLHKTKMPTLLVITLEFIFALKFVLIEYQIKQKNAGPFWHWHHNMTTPYKIVFSQRLGSLKPGYPHQLDDSSYCNWPP